jgi:protein-S-isoprenylcysteine O-methyltransferase Ste14
MGFLLMAPRLFAQTAIWLAITGALLFVPAGTIYWPEAWVFLAELGVIGLASAFSIAKHDPELMRERMRAPLQRGQKNWDKVLMSVFFLLWWAQQVAAGLDAVRYQASHVPLALKIAGALGVAVSLAIFHIVLRENTYAAPVVKIQTERAHKVIDTGPYALVRHPMYAGAVLYFLCAPLLLGSWYGLAIGFIIVALLGYRAVLEEETLKAELAGYSAYAARVPYRLVPGVW